MACRNGAALLPLSCAKMISVFGQMSQFRDKVVEEWFALYLSIRGTRGPYTDVILLCDLLNIQPSPNRRRISSSMDVAAKPFFDVATEITIHRTGAAGVEEMSYASGTILSCVRRAMRLSWDEQ